MRRMMLCFLLCCCACLRAEEKSLDTKILVPVVADQGGKPVLDLQATNFSVEGAKGIQLSSVQMVPAEAMNDPQHTFPVFILYDAYYFTAPVQAMVGADLLQFLTDLSQHYSPVTLVVNTPMGLKLVYDFGTDPRILGDALAALDTGAKVSDPKVKDQLEKLKLLKIFVPAPAAVEDLTIVQFGGLEHMAQVLGRSPNRKALVWMTWNYRLGTGDRTVNWTGSTLSQDKSLTMNSGTRAEVYANNLPDSRYQNLPPLYEKAIAAVNGAHVSVFPLQQYDRRDTSLTINSPSDQVTTEGLRQVAACTGGTSIKDFKQTSVAQAVAQVRAGFGPYYILTLTASDIKKTDWIPLKVRVDRPAVTIRTAPGFLGLSPSAAKSAGIVAK
jgi:VWFA-related protein